MARSAYEFVRLRGRLVLAVLVVVALGLAAGAAALRNSAKHASTAGGLAAAESRLGAPAIAHAGRTAHRGLLPGHGISVSIGKPHLSRVRASTSPPARRKGEPGEAGKAEQEPQSPVTPIGPPRRFEHRAVAPLRLVRTIRRRMPQGLPQDAPGDFLVNRDADLGCSSTSAATGCPTANKDYWNRSLVSEPSVATDGTGVLETWNWYAARSANGGTDWTYMDPTTAFPNSYGGFCCDQLAYYEPTHNLYVWVLQYLPDGSNKNAIRVAVANGDAGLAGGPTSFYYWDLKPSDIGSTGDWYDQPKISSSSNFLYVEASRYAASGGTFAGSVVIRLPLATLASHGSLTEDAYAPSTFSPAPVQGATSTMYFGGHVNTSTLRLYIWPEAVGPSGVTTQDVAHSRYPRNDPYSCPRVGGTANSDWCPRISSTGGYVHDDRINSGWLENGVIGFSWDASQGSVAGGVVPTFAYPYAHVVRIALSATNVLTVTRSGSGNGTVTSSGGGIKCGENCSASLKRFTRLDEPIMWNPGYAIQWSALVANANGDIAGVVEWGGGANYENCGAVVHDAYTTPSLTSFWEFHSLEASNADTGERKSGDYLTIRASGNTWSGACYVLQNGGSGGDVHPHYINFGRRTTGSPLPTPAPPTVTSKVTLRAAPAAGSDFVGWSGGGCRGTRPCTVSFSAAQSVTAEFEPALKPPSVLSAVVGPGKTIKLTRGGSKVQSLTHGKFKFVVQDKTKKDNFHLTCKGVNKKTGVKTKSRTTWSVTLTKGTCSYKSDASKKLKGSFKVK